MHPVRHAGRRDQEDRQGDSGQSEFGGDHNENRVPARLFKVSRLRSITQEGVHQNNSKIGMCRIAISVTIQMASPLI